ncbi:alkaline ceramidase [Aquiflexum lacus]|uniref:alkaline ceramidase n=1 Tax=Aquiflexum lacus TaxID=2483805 RepID=UPI001894B6CC|nr:alkaline ceramidase [Aquiflexum lacus]
MPSSIAHRIFKVFAWILGIIVFLALATLTRVDWRDYKEMDYYHETMAHLDTLSIQSTEGETWFAGWSSVNATPNSPAKLVGYKPRGRYQFVQDSSFVKTLVVGNGKSNVAFLNYELMIVHPYLFKRVHEAIEKENLSLDHIYFTATHTHSGMGGYIPGIVGKLALGGKDEKIINLLTSKTIASLKEAINSQDSVAIIFQKSRADSLVANRLIAEDPIDPFIRQMIFEKRNGQKAVILTFSAHSTILNSKFMGLSGDYPHYLTKIMEDSGYEFSLFAAGTVGSHRPVPSGNQAENVLEYAEDLHKNIEGNIVFNEKNSQNNLNTAEIPLELRKAHYRIREKTRLRPWIFNLVFGDTNPHFDMVQIGNTLFISSSGEISGVFMSEWESLANEKGLNLIITCFNGGYIGYITPDEYYNYKLYEVRDMNWFGPYNGAYFDEIIQNLIEKAK